MTTQQAIDLTDVTFAWPGSSFGLSIDRFQVRAGETVLLLGSSGTGKSTLLSLIGGIALPASGRVDVCGADMTSMRGPQRDRHRAENIGVIFQMFNLLPYLTGLDNILLPLRFAPTRKGKCSDPKSEALRLAESLGLSHDMLTRQPASQLSVGQQQRVAVARALIGAPPVILADEPTSALDETARDDFLRLSFQQLNAMGSTMIMVSHDVRLAPHFDRVLQLSDIARMEQAGDA